MATNTLINMVVSMATSTLINTQLKDLMRASSLNMATSTLVNMLVKDPRKVAAVELPYDKKRRSHRGWAIVFVLRQTAF